MEESGASVRTRLRFSKQAVKILALDSSLGPFISHGINPTALTSRVVSPDLTQKKIYPSEVYPIGSLYAYK